MRENSGMLHTWTSKSCNLPICDNDNDTVMKTMIITNVIMITKLSLHEFDELLVNVRVLLSIAAILRHTVSELLHQLLFVNAVLRQWQQRCRDRRRCRRR